MERVLIILQAALQFTEFTLSVGAVKPIFAPNNRMTIHARLVLIKFV